jgi:DNA polymerase/3'-5' exonuclease PolX
MLPDSFLSQLVINLKKEGFLTDHLAVPRGVDLNSGAMDKFVTRDPPGSSTSSHSSSSSSSSTSTKSTAETKGTSNYMGVCKLNDRPHRRHRRIDIKVYPRDQVPFAMLYFSGPDHFGRYATIILTQCNLSLYHSLCYDRSIRQHAKLQGYKLNDKGLFPVTSEGVESGPSLPCKTERDIFSALGVEYCPPQERNLFENLTATLPVKEEQKG